MIQQHILQSVEDSIQAMRQLKTPDALLFFQKASRMIVETFSQRHKLLVAGNGGSLCEAMHFAEELTGQFRRRRPPLAAIALADPGHITCTANDYGFESIFSRGVEALGNADDLFVGLSTSGNSPNIILAFQTARKLGLKTMAFLGRDGGKLRGFADVELIIEETRTSDRIQEAHLTAMHLLIELVENALYPIDSKTSSNPPPASVKKVASESSLSIN